MSEGPRKQGMGRGRRRRDMEDGDRGRGEGRRRGIGRPRAVPNISGEWSGIDGSVSLILSKTELEIIKLVDIDNKTQEEVAKLLDVSRATIWRYLQSARHKIASSITSGKIINIEINE